MYKLKTNKSARKRFRFTKSGKVKSSSSKKRHLLERKSQKMKRQARGTHVVHERDVKSIKKLIPYGD